MPDYNTAGPASTPQLYLENEYRQLQRRAADWEKNLQAQGLDEAAYADEIGKKQKELNEQIEFFQAKSQELRQTQSMVDLGLIDSQAAGTEAMWASVLPEEVRKAMYPKQPEVSKREPLSVNELENVKESVEEFAGQTPKTKISKRYGIGKTDFLARDVKGRSQADTIKKYYAWRDFIGYEGLTPVEQKQVDSQWDGWIAGQKGTWKWNPGSRQVKAIRAKGPLTRAYGSQFRRTPTGPTEAVNPLQMSIARALPKKKEEPQKPTAGELRSKGTPEAYEIGKNLGYW